MTKETKKSAAQAESSDAAYLTFIAAAGESDERFEIRYEDENIWLSQRMMAELYAVDVRTINEHIKKIYYEPPRGQAAGADRLARAL